MYLESFTGNPLQISSWIINTAIARPCLVFFPNMFFSETRYSKVKSWLNVITITQYEQYRTTGVILQIAIARYCVLIIIKREFIILDIPFKRSVEFQKWSFSEQNKHDVAPGWIESIISEVEFKTTLRISSGINNCFAL